MKNKLFLTLILLAPAVFGAKAESLQNELNIWRTENHITSVIVSVQDSTGKITDLVSGTTVLNGKTPISAKNLFGVGSITKTFVSATILQLQEEHKLKLDDRLKNYFPEYPLWKNITIRQLLNMTSGIYNYNDSLVYQKLRDAEPKTVVPSKTLIDIAYQSTPYFAPTKGWHYSNTNYLLLGLIIEKVTHQPLSEVLKQRIFNPLKLNNTFYSAGFYPANVTKRMAHGYYKGKDMSHFNASIVGVGSAGAMVMNSHDLLTWAHALFTPGIILSKKSIHDLQKTAPDKYSKAPFPIGSHFGLGVISLDVPELGIIWFYTGVINGYTSVFIWLPSQHKSIAVQVATWPAPHFKVVFPNQDIMKKILRFAA